MPSAVWHASMRVRDRMLIGADGGNLVASGTCPFALQEERPMPSQKSVGTAITIMLCLVIAVVTITQLQALRIWSPTGSMSMARGSSGATLLPDGRVLVTGGWGYSVDYPGYATPVAGAELYESEARHVDASGCHEHGPQPARSHTTKRRPSPRQRRYDGI